MKKTFSVGDAVVVSRKDARVWLDDDGDMTHLEAGTSGVVSELRGSLTVVDFRDTKWAGRPVKIKTAEIELVA